LISVGEGPRLFRYFVTARHVVEDSNPKWIRFRGANGAPPVDKSVDRWVSHSTSDIAIAPCDLDLGAETLIAFWQEDKFFCDVFPPGRQIEPGADAYFIGLLSEISAMAENAIPMVRAASIGAMYVTDVAVQARLPSGGTYKRREPRAHVIDTYSRAGFSGSPVYVQDPVVQADVTDESEPPPVAPDAPKRRQITFATRVLSFSALFGVLVGHFASSGDNAGVGIVVPVEAIRELLEYDELVEWRRRKEQAMEEADRDREDENAAVLDIAEPESEFAQFEDLTRKLVNVPKKELDEKRKEES